MIDPWSILTMLRTLTATEEPEDILLPLCTAVAAELDTRLRSEADPADIRLIHAGAAMAQHQLALRALQGGAEVETFKAGDVTVSVSPGALREAAAQEMTRALTQALPLLRDEEFLFRQVTV